MSFEILMEVWPNEMREGYHSTYGISDILICRPMLSPSDMKTYDDGSVNNITFRILYMPHIQ